jgi:hypothetical protein
MTVFVEEYTFEQMVLGTLCGHVTSSMVAEEPVSYGDSRRCAAARRSANGLHLAACITAKEH